MSAGLIFEEYRVKRKGTNHCDNDLSLLAEGTGLEPMALPKR